MSSISEKKQKLNYAFIDSQNLNLEIQRLGWKLDFKKNIAFLNNLKNKLEYKKTRPERPGCF